MFKDKALWLLFFLTLFSDQFSKIVAVSNLFEGERIPVLEGLFNFTLVYNPGAAFGMFAGLPDVQRRIALVFVSLVALLVVFYMMKETKEDRPSQVALIAILAGAVGNLIDRFRYDGVVDFLDVYWGNYHWPAFNIADSAISIGVGILMARLLFTDLGQPQPGET